MENKAMKLYLQHLFSSSIFLLMFMMLIVSPAQAFFENQAKYAFEQRWLPMLVDSEAEKRFQAMQAFLTFPNWGLPVLRKSLKNSDSTGENWQTAMLIGMLGDSADIPVLLEKWRELKNIEHKTVWLGAVRRLYRKNYLPATLPPKLTSLSVIFPKKAAEDQNDTMKTASLSFSIDNPASVARLIRVGVHFWRTRLQENMPERYYWIPAGAQIESSIDVRILPVVHSSSIRLDFRLWDVGKSVPTLHQVGEIPITDL
ncbi:MAG: hypothetical protein H8E38_05390 [SAR324 cluster bacterium]|nr:hypothetical protein [SAR324 cluster bacterium]MBL7034140.1 hypothetical protein [SAR324 cluster bacterium]